MNRVIKYGCCIFLAVCLSTMLGGCSLSFFSDLYPPGSELEIRSEHGSESTSDTDVDTRNTSEESSTADSTSQDTVPEDAVYVHVCGCVKNPGLYVLREGDRVDAAIRAAGGFTKKADEKSVNLAELLVDGTQIEVLSRGESSGKGSSGSTEAQKVNLNEADKTQLMTLNGIGESRADSILSYREEHGSFSSIEELKDVDGIGDGIYQKIKNTITV